MYQQRIIFKFLNRITVDLKTNLRTFVAGVLCFLFKNSCIFFLRIRLPIFLMKKKELMHFSVIHFVVQRAKSVRNITKLYEIAHLLNLELH